MHYYPHHIGDFIKDTANLNDHQMVTYLRMIWAYYTDEKPLPDECDGIAFAMRSDEKTVHLLLRHYFDLQEDGWHHKRCDRVLQEIYGKSEKARDAANKRWEKEKKKMQPECERNADAMQTHTNEHADASLFDATQYPIPNINISSGKPSSGLAKQEVNKRFEEFWEAYQKKVGKQDAIKVWKSLKLDDKTIDELIAKARLYVSIKPESQYRKDPARWLKGKHWEDDFFADSVHLSSTGSAVEDAL